MKKDHSKWMTVDFLSKNKMWQKNHKKTMLLLMQQSLTFLHLNVDKYHLSNTDGSDKTVLALEVMKHLALNFTEAFFFGNGITAVLL